MRYEVIKAKDREEAEKLTVFKVGGLCVIDHLEICACGEQQSWSVHPIVRPLTEEELRDVVKRCSKARTS